jgi:hypothetical protein
LASLSTDNNANLVYSAANPSIAGSASGGTYTLSYWK